MFRRLGDHLVNVVSFGSGEPPVVGVGGWIGNWELWQQPFEVVSRRRRVVAYDHPGAGETVAAGEALRFERQVETLFAVLEAEGIERCVLAGESNGAAVAIEAVLREPDRFLGLVLVVGAYTAFDDPTVSVFAEHLTATPERVLPGFVQLCVPEPDGAHVRRWLAHILARADVDAAVWMLEDMRRVDVAPRLAELSLPTLLVHGRLDALPATRPERAEHAAAAIPGARLVLLDDAGHVPTLTRPQAVADAIEEFLASL